MTAREPFQALLEILVGVRPWPVGGRAEGSLVVTATRIVLPAGRQGLLFRP